MQGQDIHSHSPIAPFFHIISSQETPHTYWRSHIPTQPCTLKMTPMYETIPDNPMQGSLPKKPETKPLDANGYVQIIDAVSDKKSMQIHKLIALHAHHLVMRRKVIYHATTQRKERVQSPSVGASNDTPTILSQPDHLRLQIAYRTPLQVLGTLLWVLVPRIPSTVYQTCYWTTIILPWPSTSHERQHLRPSKHYFGSSRYTGTFIGSSKHYFTLSGTSWVLNQRCQVFRTFH